MVRTAANITDLLDRLENVSDTAGNDAVETRRQIWNEISEAAGFPARELANQIAAALGVSPVTSARWIAGSFAPRPSLLKQLRSYFKVAPASGGLEPDPAVPFAGSFAALRTLDHFFYCLKFAKSSFVFKGLLEFHAGQQQKTRSRLVQALADKESLTIYYVFPQHSAAQGTFEELQKTIKSDYPGKGESVLLRIKSIGIPVKNDVLGLDFTFASPFVILYDKDGRKEFQRSVDIWYELPVEPLNSANEVQDDRPLYVFVQLPSANSKELWEKWKEKLPEWQKQVDSKTNINADDLS